jgi:tetratricopeptide (TPR) repeat protein
MFDAVSTLLAAITHQQAGRPAAAETLLRQVLDYDPDEPSALFLLGSTVLGLGRAAEAAALLGRAVAIRPQHRQQRQALARALLATDRPAEALAALAPLASESALAEVQYLRGTALNALGRPQDAASALRDAVAAAPGHAEAHLNLGNALADLADVEAAEAHMRQAITLQPDLAEAHASLGFLLTGRGALDAAVAACQRAIDVRPDFAVAHWNQGIAYLLDGRMAEGWAQYEWRKQRFPAAFTVPPGPQWGGEALAGRSLLVLAEQGFGDTIQLCRYLPPLVASGTQVVLECAPCLMGLLDGLPGLTLIPPHGKRPAYDFWADQMSLPRLFRTTLETIPCPDSYLRPDPARAASWADILPAGLRIGLVWAGNPAHSNDSRRSIPVAAVAPLLAAAPGALVSLQVGTRAAEAAQLPGLIDHTAALTDFAETAALVAGLDLVITVDTAVAHLAGALGVPTWVMLPYAPDWRWLLHRVDSPWYSAMRLFRQAQPGDWDGVIAQVATALRAVATERYSIAMPPLTCSVAPVTQPASAEAR